MNTLRDQRLNVQALNGSPAAIPGVLRGTGTDEEWTRDDTTFLNLRAAMYWQLREDLRRGRVAMRRDDDLFRELVTPTTRSATARS